MEALTEGRAFVMKPVATILSILQLSEITVGKSQEELCATCGLIVSLPGGKELRI